MEADSPKNSNPNTAASTNGAKAIDTNWQYCRRLAEIVVPILIGDPEAVAADAQEACHTETKAAELTAKTVQSRTSRAPSDKSGLRMEDLQQIFGSGCPLPVDAFRSVDALTEKLVNCPDVQSRLSVITQYTPSKWLLERELEACAWWPQRHDTVPANSPAYKPRLDGYADAYEVARCRHASGLALSGGGIRSATFSLGILQGMARHGRISCFDYLSSVSGGGYIHQFLANWIHKADDVEKVEELLDPIPNEPGPFPRGGNNSVMPEPLRWLRRYSNYLAPRKGLFSLDPWTIAATWARNTALNLTILLAGLFCVMLLPHLGTLPIHSLAPHPWLLNSLRGLLAVVFAYVIFKVDNWLGNMTPPGPKPLLIKAACASLFGAALLVSPAVYSSAVPQGSIGCTDAERIFGKTTSPAHLHFQGSWAQMQPSTQTVEVTVDERDPAADSRVATGWNSRPDLLWRYVMGKKPDKACLVPDHKGKRVTAEQAAAEAQQTAAEDSSRRLAILIPLGLFLLLCGLLFRSVFFLDFVQKERAPGAPLAVDECEPDSSMPEEAAERRWWHRFGPALRWIFSPVVTVLGVLLAWGMVEGLRLVFFVACFAVPLHLIPSLAVMLLPPLLFGVPYVVMEIALGLVGRRADSGQREWMARARAFSFLLGGTWGVFTFFSLFGYYVFNTVAHSMLATYSVWGGWVLTTIGGVLAGQSKHTNQNPDNDPDETTKSSTAMDLLARFAPLVFVGGLLILVGTACEWAIQVPRPFVNGHPVISDYAHTVQREHRFELLFGASALIALIFGWRIDINEFSMNPFYRDRLARCYAGAVDPDRKANLFTGFTRKDRCLHMHQLLPQGWSMVRRPGRAPVQGTYKGPMPIVCTAINLTTGEDLAYQERKAGSFVFTPLYSGYSVGFTSARDNKNQYNGFVETESYVRNETGPISMATACAISGAAASPNMGYHTSPAVAFLLTVFNVRLGWWMRNPRRRSIWGKSPYPFTPGARGDWGLKLKSAELPPSPQMGVLNLTHELLGMTNDTAPYVYLSDGGHFDNMGLYELLRRRCRTIVICDGEEDGKLTFDGLGMAIRKARLDFGVEVVLEDIDPVRAKDWKREEEEMWRGCQPYPQSDPHEPGKAAPEPKTSAGPSHDSDPAYHQEEQEPGKTCEGIGSFRYYPPGKDERAVHCVHGTIRYPEDKREEQFGHILYIKASLTGDEPADVLNYRRTHENFPHDSTLNQFFSESEFESYRRLGEHIALIDPTVISWFKRYLDPVTGPKKV